MFKIENLYLFFSAGEYDLEILHPIVFDNNEQIVKYLEEAKHHISVFPNRLGKDTNGTFIEIDGLKLKIYSSEKTKYKVLVNNDYTELELEHIGDINQKLFFLKVKNKTVEVK